MDIDQRAYGYQPAQGQLDELRRRSAERNRLLQALIDLKREALPYIWESPAFKAAHDVLVSIGK